MANSDGREPLPRAQITVVGEFQNIVDRTACLPAHDLEDLGIFALVEDENGGQNAGQSNGNNAPKPTKAKKKSSRKRIRTK